jgi:hypothetical protein
VSVRLGKFEAGSALQGVFCLKVLHTVGWTLSRDGSRRGHRCERAVWRDRPAGRPLRLDQFSNRCADLAGEAARVVRVVTAEDEHARALTQGDVGELLGPLLGRALKWSTPGGEEAVMDGSPGWR